MLPSRAEERALVERIVEAGAADGITRRCELSVDGMPLDRSLDTLDELRDLARHGHLSRFAPPGQKPQLPPAAPAAAKSGAPREKAD